MRIHLIFVFSLVFFISCSKLINEEKLKLYNGLLYDPVDGKPYTGTVYKLYSNGLKMRDIQVMAIENH